MYCQNFDIPPKPLKRKISPKIEDPFFFEMENGLRVVLVENHRIPIVRIGMSLDTEPVQEGNKAGLQAVFGKMLLAGTKKYKKEELENLLDYMGVTVYTSFKDIELTTMKRYLKKSMELMHEIVMHSRLDNQEELKRIVNQKIITIKISEKDPSEILEKVKNIIFFGRKHPYGEYESSKSLRRITIKDIQDLYNEYYAPNKFYLHFVGDISKEEVKDFCDIYFSDWKEKPFDDTNDEKEDLLLSKKHFIPRGIEIDLIDLPYLTQSHICIGNPIFLRKEDPLYIPSILSNGILGSGPQSRLFLNIREKKAYTYGISSTLMADEYIGFFSIDTQVKNKKTGNTIKEILNEINQIVNHGINLEELEIKKQEMIGQFILSLEDLYKTCDCFISESKEEAPMEFHKNYIKNINAVTFDEVNESCRKFFHMENERILVVGNGKEIFSSLNELGYPIRFFDRNGFLTDKKF
ncbi:M16 family metallopeptidase [Blattabacterium cuenoti]|uniref:M16 family metallopeptidase n=1 Tax=Blattabacterium cuenoti TaxID=1653831 RepID=UPI00163C5064|nr:pitrilysin family protein [Blattabacterium cuenoti]